MHFEPRVDEQSSWQDLKFCVTSLAPHHIQPRRLQQRWPLARDNAPRKGFISASKHFNIHCTCGCRIGSCGEPTRRKVLYLAPIQRQVGVILCRSEGCSRVSIPVNDQGCTFLQLTQHQSPAQSPGPHLSRKSLMLEAVERAMPSPLEIAPSSLQKQTMLHCNEQ